MKRGFRFITAAAMTFAVALTAAGCSSSSSSSESSSAQSSASSQQETSSASQESGTKFNIGIMQLTDHEALNASREGFVDALSDNGLVEGENITIDYQNAQNDQSNLKTISQRFVQNDVDLVLAIATGAAQSIAAETSEIPILGTAITDFEAAQLVESNEVPGGNVSGTSDLSPVSDQIDLLVEMCPDIKTLGILYNSSEINSEIQSEMAQEAAQEKGIECKIGTVTNTNDISQVIESIAGEVDALYIPTDNTFASAMATVAQIAEEYGLPTMCGESGQVKNGGLATTGVDFYNIGYRAGEMAVDILENGADISQMPVEQPTDNAVCINLDAAKAIGYEFPQSVIDKASIVYENGEETQK